MRTCPTCQRSFSDETSFCPRDGTPLPAAPTQVETGILGTITGRYRIIRPLGAGGMGTVFLAEQIAVGNRPVAVKLLARKLLDDPQFLERFHNEAASTGRVRHPNVVTVYESGLADDGTPYIAMEYLEGKNLRQTIELRGWLPVAEAVEIIQQAARGLNAAHKLGIIHRDLKPDNIFLTRDDEGVLLVKVVDFGIAKLRESASHTVTGGFLGTPAYMSFEQAGGMRSDQLDARSDVYSLGIVTYEMLTGRLPFEADTSLGFVRKHLTEPPAPLRLVRPDLALTAEIEPALLKSLEKDRSRRYDTVLDFARAFSEASKISVPAPAAAPEQQSGARGAAPQGPRAVWQPEGYKIPSEAKSRGQKSPPESAIAVQTPTPTPASPRTPVESGGMRQGAAASSQFEPAGPESSSRGSGTTHEMPAEPQTIPPAFGTAHRVRKDVMRGLKREGRIRRRMEKLGRRLQASSPLKTPLWRRPLPLALLALLVIIFIARVSHHSTSRKTAESKSNHGEVDVRQFAEAEKQQAEKIREQVARELGEQGLKIPPQGTHPEGLPAPGIPEVPSTWGAASTPQAKIFLVPRASAHWQGEVKEGDIVGQEFIDGGLKLESASVPPRVLEHAPKGSFVTLQLRVETTGKIYEGRRLAGDATAAKLLIEAAQEGWRFNAPKVNGVPVRTRADIVVHF